MRRAGWALLAVLVLATLGVMAWSLLADSDPPPPMLDDVADAPPQPPALKPAVVAAQASRPAPPAPRPAAPRPAAAAPVEEADPGLAVVQGQVLDPDGKPAPFAQILSADPPFSLRAVSGEDGTFRVAGDVGLVVAAHDQYGPSAASAPQQGGRWVLRLGPGGRIEGRVLDGQGRPVPQARVAVSRYEPAPGAPRGHRSPQPVIADDEGRYVLAPLAPGSYGLRANAAGYVPGQVDGLQLVASGRLQTDIRLPLGASVSGRVTKRADGSPVAGAQVLAADPSRAGSGAAAMTDADGRYVVKGVAPGRTSLRVQHPEFRAEMVSGIEVADGAEAVRDIALSVRQPGEHFSFQGIGASLRRDGDAIVIGGIMADSPAGRAGLQAEDRIVSVDRASVGGMGLPQVVERIRGEAGTVVLIEVDRPGQGRITIQVDRGEVVVKDPQ